MECNATLVIMCLALFMADATNVKETDTWSSIVEAVGGLGNTGGVIENAENVAVKAR